MKIGTIRIPARISIVGGTIGIPFEEVTYIENSLRTLSPLIEQYGIDRYGAKFVVGQECVIHDGAIDFPVICKKATNDAGFTLSEFQRWGRMRRAGESTEPLRNVRVEGDLETALPGRLGAGEDDQVVELSRDDVRRLRRTNEPDNSDPVEDVVEKVHNAVGLNTSLRQIVIIGADVDAYSPMDVIQGDEFDHPQQVLFLKKVEIVPGRPE